MPTTASSSADSRSRLAITSPTRFCSSPSSSSRRKLDSGDRPSDGAVQNYFNSSMSQEMVYTTSGASADVSGGGVRLNMVPRDGGNVVNGSLFSGFQDKSFQSSNLTDDLKARRLFSHTRNLGGAQRIALLDFARERHQGIALRPSRLFIFRPIPVRAAGQLSVLMAEAIRLRLDEDGAIPGGGTQRATARASARAATGNAASQPGRYRRSR